MMQSLKPLPRKYRTDTFLEIRTFKISTWCSSCGEEIAAYRPMWTYDIKDDDYVDILCSECDLIENYDLPSSWSLLLAYYVGKVKTMLEGRCWNGWGGR